MIWQLLEDRKDFSGREKNAPLQPLLRLLDPLIIL